MSNYFIFKLLLLYQFKHFLCDFPLQTEWMLGKFKPGWDFVLPLTVHAGIHMLATMAIVSYCGFSMHSAFLCGLFDFFIHFTMDRIKASPNYLGRFKPLNAHEYDKIKESIYYRETKKALYVNRKRWHRIDQLIKADKDRLRGNKYFWWSIGFDQMVHHLTHYAVIYFMAVLKIA